VKRLVFVFTILLCTAGPVQAFDDDICRVLRGVAYGSDEAYQKVMHNLSRTRRAFRGSGEVREVMPKGIRRSYHWVLIDCENIDVIVKLVGKTDDLLELEKGDRVYFSGKFRKMETQEYTDMKMKFILVTLTDVRIR
jgi:hypothetical protein